MNPPVLPPEVPWDERAIILDEQQISYVDIGRFSGGDPVYTTTGFLEHSSKTLMRIMQGIRGLNTSQMKRSFGDLFGLQFYRALDDFLSDLPPERIHSGGGRRKKEELLRAIRSGSYFLEGKGYLVDESNRKDILSQRLHYNQERLRELIPIVVRPFLREMVGTISEPLEERIVDQLAEEYRRKLEQFDPEMKIQTTQMNDLIEKLKYFSTTGYQQLKTRDTQEDVTLVALGASIPAHKVVIFSNDLNIQQLTWFGGLLLPMDNTIMCRWLNKRNRQEHQTEHSGYREFLY